MNQIRPFIPLVQNGTMSIEEFKRKMQGYRAATKQDFDNYLLHALERDVAEVERLPELGQWHRNINPDSPLSASDTVEAAQSYRDSWHCFCPFISKGGGECALQALRQ